MNLVRPTLADESRTGPPPGKRKGPASVEALGRAIAEVLTNVAKVEAEPVETQADAATLDALADGCADAAMRLVELALRKKEVSP